MPQPIQEITSNAASAVTLLHGGALGDFVLAVQWLCRLRVGDAAHGRAVVARSPMSALSANALPIDRLADVDTLQLHALFAPGAALTDALAARLATSTLVIDMQAHGDATAVARLRDAAGGPVVSVDPAPLPGDRRHITDQWTAKVRAAGVPVTVVESNAAWFASGRKPRSPQRPTALLHPGSGGRAKCWPIERFIALARQLISARVDVQFILGPTELAWHGRSWTDSLSVVAPVIEDADLLLLAERIANSDLYVGNDAGGTHLAAATGTPTLALFGPTDSDVWRPIGSAVRVLAAAGAPNAAMEQFALERVFDACMDMISESPAAT